LDRCYMTSEQATKDMDSRGASETKKNETPSNKVANRGATETILGVPTQNDEESTEDEVEYSETSTDQDNSKYFDLDDDMDSFGFRTREYDKETESHDLESENTEDLGLETNDELMEEYRAIKKWCKREIKEIFDRAEQEDRLEWAVAAFDDSVESFSMSSETDVCFMNIVMRILGTRKKYWNLKAHTCTWAPIAEIMVRIYFYLGLTKYDWDRIPNPEGKMPRNPSRDYDLGDRYCKMPWQYEAESKYSKDILAWKLRQLEIIWSMDEETLKKWKKAYRDGLKRRLEQQAATREQQRKNDSARDQGET
jgi:hypothetical protein